MTPMARLAALYREHGPDLLRYLRRAFPRAGASAEDLLQETFVQAAASLRRAGEVDGARSPRAWLFGIARHIGLTAARRARPHQPLGPEVREQAEARGGAEAGDEDPRLDPMRAAIEQLPPLLREALELRLREELSYEEIADVLGVPVGTVRSRLHHAVRRLRESLTRTGPDGHGPQT